MHVTHNVPAIKMYLLDLFIRDASGGQKDVTAFVRALWDTAKEFTEPQQVSEKQVVAALGFSEYADCGAQGCHWQGPRRVLRVLGGVGDNGGSGIGGGFAAGTSA